MTDLKTESSHWPLLRPLDDSMGTGGIVLNRNVCVVGRDRVHLPLPSIQVSRAHALVVNDGRSIYVRDLASKNGVYRNGEPVRETELLHSDVLGIGHLRFRCESGFENSEVDPQEPVPSELRIDGSAIGLPVTQRTFLVGTREGCDAVVKGTAVSPVHAVIFRRGSKHFVRDLNSESGTFVNGRRTRESELSSGDEIRVGTITLCYQHGPADAENREAVDQFDFTDASVEDAPVLQLKDDAVAEADDVNDRELAIGSSQKGNGAAKVNGSSSGVDDEDLTIRVWDLMEPEEHADHPSDPERPATELPGHHSWNERSDAGADAVKGLDTDEPRHDEPRHHDDTEKTADSSGAEENFKEMDPERRRAEEIRVAHILGRLSRNVRGLRSAWKTLYEPHGRSGERESARRPD